MQKRIYPKKIAPGAEEYEARALTIINDFDSRKRLNAPNPFDSAWGTFKREAYGLIRRTKGSEGGHNVIKGIVSLANVEPARLRYRGNEFHWGLLALDPEFDVLDAKRVSLFARQMTYADLHDVAAHHLVGFLYQSGSPADVSKKLLRNEREPWFGKR